jgi:cobalt-precorrin-5B (C1)-methyltransferase
MREHLPTLPPEAFVQMGDYVRFALKLASRMGFKQITVAAFFGKAVKMAQGRGHTHASRGLANLRELGRWTEEITGDARLAQAVAHANTARQVLEILSAARAAAVVAAVGGRVLNWLRDFAGPGPELNAVLLDFSGAPLWRGQSAGGLEP